MPPLFRTALLTTLLAASGLSFASAQPASGPSSPALSPATVTEPAPTPAGGLRLSPRSAAGNESQTSSPSGLPSLVTVFGSLGIVLAAFFVLAWLMKRGIPKNMGMLPTEVVEVLGRAPLGQRQHVHLMRCGSRLLLVSVSATGAETLSEITDPVEVDRLTGICAQHRGDSVTASFRQVLNQFGRTKTDGEADLENGSMDAADLSGSHGRGSTREGMHV